MTRLLFILRNIRCDIHYLQCLFNILFTRIPKIFLYINIDINNFIHFRCVFKNDSSFLIAPCGTGILKYCTSFDLFSDVLTCFYKRDCKEVIFIIANSILQEKLGFMQIPLRHILIHLFGEYIWLNFSNDPKGIKNQQKTLWYRIDVWFFQYYIRLLVLIYC